MRRYSLPPLDLIQGFEAAARTLSFTKAAEELSLTQSAVSRQIRALEESLGVALFERHTRALSLTAEGRRLQRVAEEVLGLMHDATQRIKAERSVRHLTVSTTAGLATLWLIPRLKRFTALHPDVDVRISATYKPVSLERGDADVAVRYTKEESPPPGAIRLFGEEVTPVCSPALVDPARTATPVRTLKDLEAHTLLHMDGAQGILDWETWLVAEGYADLRPAGALRIDSYDQLIQAALGGQGIALGIRRLVQHLLEDGSLVVPFNRSMVSQRAYYVLRAPMSRSVPHVDAFVEWLRKEAEICVGAPPT
ncbi:MAG: LysR substrate-binding domain-containing protein [Hyphomicrobiaceae bacterium]|nr:LysR substrate-binding domain-containing protein [Hyphomicrobiaceae bacterium]